MMDDDPMYLEAVANARAELEQRFKRDLTPDELVVFHWAWGRGGQSWMRRQRTGKHWPPTGTKQVKCPQCQANAVQTLNELIGIKTVCYFCGYGK